MKTKETATLIRRAMTAGDLTFRLGPRGGAEETARAIVEAVVPQWQPIETAPRDGTEFIVASFPKGFMELAVRGWIGRAAFTNLRGEYSAPTHWMPLPSPPAGPGHE